MTAAEVVSVTVGDVLVQSVSDGTGRERASAALSRVSDPEAWRSRPQYFGADDSWEFPLGVQVVRSGEEVVLVDAGYGPGDRGPDYVGGALLHELRRTGVDPDAVTQLVFTHFHADHLGWISEEGEPVFPRAVLRAHVAEWENAVRRGPATADRDRLLAVADRFELFDRETTIAPGVDALPAPGHTPGSAVYVISSGGERCLLLGDVAHSPVQLEERDWRVRWDADPELASATRNALADEAAATGALVTASHFPGLAFGRITVTGGARRFTVADGNT
ncbi:MBL fold metallo-hydrolase [Cnuibacter physcomitrellae]|uniref:MBL fold metallo-hydrolase n=1 Tax=Cnuibacter physcomitrellae TaxID=1619308 RepID=UPI002175D9B9|nr:MBL fold metallo-hydrolase [Cnuibacter physcomitrellae]MCS5498298.1 MBL fold metallo-hydrolase [Cnuibacter physcomitrellae]